MRLEQMQRRTFIALLGGAVACPVAARGQQRAMPVDRGDDDRAADAGGAIGKEQRARISHGAEAFVEIAKAVSDVESCR